VEFGVEIGEYRGVVRVPRRVFQRLPPDRPTPDRCVEAYYLQRTRFESIAERKLRRCRLTEDGNVEIGGRDLREVVGADAARASLKPPQSTRSRHSLRVTRSAGRDRRANQPALRLCEGPGSGVRSGASDSRRIAHRLRARSCYAGRPRLPVCVRRWGEKDVPL
jgi:hypothetical protein